MAAQYDPPPTDAQHLDATYALLSDRRRRQVVTVLSERDPPTTADDLAAAIASRDDGSETTADEIAARLHHVHLPRLADAGVVDYDPEANTVTPARPDVLDELSRIVDEANEAIETAE